MSGSSDVQRGTEAPIGKKAEVRIEVELDDDDFRKRVIVTGPPEEATEAASEMTVRMMQAAERARFRNVFFMTAHIFVFGFAVLCVIGFVLHFLNIRTFDTTYLTVMGLWTVGSLIYLYLVIVRDTFGLKEKIPRPPSST